MPNRSLRQRFKKTFENAVLSNQETTALQTILAQQPPKPLLLESLGQIAFELAIEAVTTAPDPKILHWLD